MCHFRYSLLSVLFFLFGLNNISAQVTGVDFLLEYSIDSCSYIASIIVVEGNAIAPSAEEPAPGNECPLLVGLWL